MGVRGIYSLVLILGHKAETPPTLLAVAFVLPWPLQQFLAGGIPSSAPRTGLGCSLELPPRQGKTERRRWLILFARERGRGNGKATTGSQGRGLNALTTVCVAPLSSPCPHCAWWVPWRGVGQQQWG